MPDTKRWNPYAAAAAALQSRKKDIDETSEEKSTKKDDDRTKKAEADPDRDTSEEKELMKSTPRLREYRIRKSIGSSTPAEVRLYDLQEKRVKSYKYGTKRVPKTGLAKLHKGEAVLPVKEAKKYRRAKVKAAASMLGAGKRKPAKKVAKKGFPGSTKRLVSAAGREIKENPPAILRSTKRKKGAEAADKQRVAIMLSKARAAGANIPEKG